MAMNSDRLRILHVESARNVAISNLYAKQSQLKRLPEKVKAMMIQLDYDQFIGNIEEPDTLQVPTITEGSDPWNITVTLNR